MPALQPESKNPSIIQGSDATATYLADMGIEIDDVYDALKAGESAAANTRPSAPVTAAGSRRWFSVTEVLREQLRTRGDWVLRDPDNRPIAISRDGKYRLGIVGGNEVTGEASPSASPKAHRKKGKTTQEAVNRQPALFELSKPQNTLLKGTETDAPPEGGWFLLYYRAKEEIRSEISFPAPDFDQGQFGSWIVRVILKPIPTDETTIDRIPDIGGGDVEFKIA